MATRTPPTPAVTVADRALDAHGRLWTCWHLSLDPYASQWECPATGAGATWAHLIAAYGVRATWSSYALEVAA